MRKKYDKLKFIKYLEEVPLISYAAQKVGVARSTVYRWLNSNYDFKKAANDALDLGRKGIVDLAEMGLMAKVKEKDMGAIKFVLMHNDPRYKPERPAAVQKIEAKNEEILDLRERNKRLEELSRLSEKELCEKIREEAKKAEEAAKQCEESNPKIVPGEREDPNHNDWDPRLFRRS